MKKLSLIASVILIFSVFTCTVSADTLPSEDRTPSPEPASYTSEIVPFGSTNCTLSFRRTSSSSARAQAAATRPGADWVKSTIQLQKKSGSSYVSKGSASKTSSTTIVNHIKTFSIASSGTYRIKVTITYKQNGLTRANTYYKAMT